MEILVCIKRVPDSAAKIKVGADRLSIDPSGVEYVISPYDEMALERALQLKEEQDATVTVVCLGVPEAQKEIRQALAMGADKAIHIKDEGGSRGPLEIAQALSDAIKERPYDMVLFGRQSIDADNSAVGVIAAGLLGIPISRHRGHRGQAAGGVHRAARPRRTALRIHQGHHDGEEEAYRRVAGAGAARHAKIRRPRTARGTDRRQDRG